MWSLFYLCFHQLKKAILFWKGFKLGNYRWHFHMSDYHWWILQLEGVKGPAFSEISILIPQVSKNYCNNPSPLRDRGYFGPQTNLTFSIIIHNNYIHTYILCTYIQAYIYTYIHTYITDIHTYIHTYIYTYIHTYMIHTYMHTYIDRQMIQIWYVWPICQWGLQAGT